MRFAGFVAAAIVAILSQATVGTTLRVGGTQPPPALGNPYTGVGPPSSASWSAIFDGLTVLDENGALKPALAQSWQNTSPTTWVFHLRPGVTFHNGAVLNASAVAATINYLLSADAKRFFVSGELRMVSGARVIDDLTLEISTKTPDAILPTRLNLVMIVEPDHWKTLGPEGFGLAPIGTGPYRLKDWGRARGRTILEAFPGAWRGKGAAERVELLTIADAAARQQALAAAQIDIAVGLGPEEAATLRADGFRVLRKPLAGVMAIAFRTVRPGASPLKDQRVRYALNIAVDRATIVREILGGVGAVANQGATPETRGYNPNIPPYPYDPARAKALLAEAGYPNGFKIAADVLTNMIMADASIYQKAADDLGRIGVKLDLRATTFANWARRFTSGDWQDADAFSLVWGSAPFQDAIRPIEQYSCAKVAAFACDPAIMPLIAGSNREMNPVVRQQKLQEILARLHDTAPALLLVNMETIVVASPKITDIHTRIMGIEYERVGFAP